ncbi:FHA domain-containing protein, partial [bacterium]|nr:FHA domain-containing protein [bacterium]
MIEKTSNIIVPWAVGNGMLDMPSSFELVHLFAGKEEIFIGRSPENDIWLNHPAVSRIHASLYQKSDGSLLVRDLGSTHGVTINGKHVDGEALWSPQTTLNLGPQSLWLDNDNVITVITRHGSPNLEAKDLTVIVPNRKKPILDHVSFTFKPGQFVCVLGPSGAGKTTLVRCMQGHQLTSGGTLLFGGHPILSNPTILNGLVGYAPQKMSLHETLTVRQVVWFAAKLRLPADTSSAEIENYV